MTKFREVLDEIQVLIERGECKVSDLKFLWNTMSDAITEHEASKPVIHAKALIQKGTGFCWSKTAGIWNLSYDIIPYTVECNDVPEDAELVDIEIIVKGGEK